MNETSNNKNRSDFEYAGDIFDKVHDILTKAGYTVNQVTPQALEQCRRKSGKRDDQSTPKLTVFSNSKTGLFTEDEWRNTLRHPVLMEAMRLGLLMTNGQFLMKELGMALRKEMLNVPIKMQIADIIEMISEEQNQRGDIEKG